jgi:hypothetical protein
MTRSARSVPRSIAIGLIAALGFLVPPALAPGAALAAKGKGKPDLVVKEVRLLKDQYAFRGENLDSEVEHTIANKGGRPARASTASILLRGGGEVFRLDRGGTGLLEPGESENVAPGINRRNDFPAGEYDVVVCADVREKVAESNERNNCRSGKPRFYSTYRTFTGHLSGAAPGFGGTRETWATTSETTYGPGQYIGNGLFNFPSQGNGAVKYTHQGTDESGCSYTGEGTFPIDGRLSQLMLNYRTLSYSAGATLLFGSHYTVTRNCGGTTLPMDRPVGFTPALITLQQELVFGHVNLPGRKTVEDITYTWDLAGK